MGRSVTDRQSTKKSVDPWGGLGAASPLAVRCLTRVHDLNDRIKDGRPDGMRAKQCRRAVVRCRGEESKR
jgi:hypothetical protein